MTDTYIEESKKLWCDPSKEKPNKEQINVGCLQRIANAAEAMANNHTKLIDENKWLAESRKDYMRRCEKVERSNAALRGVITRMKNAYGG